jgi:soluble lytic murein transglycosylase-like protein
MNRIQFAIFPAILLGILITILFASLAKTPETVLAYTNPTNTIPPIPTISLPTASAPGSSTPIAPVPSLSPTAMTPPTAAPSPTAGKSAPDQAAAPSANACSISKRYPRGIQQWCGLIEKYAQTTKLEPNLIAAIMLQESGGDPNAYSASGAVGLMQVMPRDGAAATFQCGTGSCFASRPSTTELFDPEYNLSYGVRMFAGLIQKNGSIREALRSYGPMNVGYYYADKVLAIYKNYQ